MVTSVYRAADVAPPAETVGESFYAPRPQSLGVRELFGVLWRRKIVVVLITIACMGLALAAITGITPQYEARTTLMFDPQQASAASNDPVIQLLRSNAPATESQIQVIGSRGVAERVVDDLDLEAIPEFNSALREPSGLSVAIGEAREALKGLLVWLGLSEEEMAGEALSPEAVAQRRHDRVVDAVLQGLDVSQVGRSQVIRVGFVSEDPELAATVANAFAEKYITQQLQARFNAMRETQEWLTESLARMREQTEAAEDRLEAYRRELSALGDRDPARIDEELSIVNEQVALRRAELQSAQALYGRVFAIYSERGADAVTGMLDSSVIGALQQNLAVLLQQRAELAGQYDSRHPLVQTIDAEIASLQGQLGNAVRSEVESLRVTADAAAQELSLLQARLQELEDLYQQVNAGAADLRLLEQEAEASRSMYETFLNRTRTAEQLVIDEPDAWIISSASVPISPIGPSKAVMMAGATLFAAFLAVAVAVALELLSTTFRTPFEIQEYVGVSIFGAVPRLTKGWSPWRFRAALTSPNAGEVDNAMRDLFISVSLATKQRRDGLVILVTSPRRREGKTTLAVLLARALARADHRTVLVDCDVRNSKLARTMRLRDNGSLTDLLASQSTTEAAVTEDGASGAMVVPAGHSSSSSAELLGGPAMAELIRRLRLEYEVIILDSPGLLTAPDGLLLARLVDAVMMVARWRSTPRQQLARALEKLRAATSAAVGAVLAQVPQRASR